jgi:hypothetical protein
MNPSVSQPAATTRPVAGGWTLERLPDATGPAEISDVVVLPDGRGIVVGADARGGGLLEPAAWFDDGDGNWRRAEITGISDTGDFSTAYTMGSIMVTDDGLVSIGIGGPGAAAFRSTDDGEHWERMFDVSGIDGDLMDAIKTDAGYVAVGSISVTDPPLRSAAMIWTSTDAISWQAAGDQYGVGALSGGFVTSLAESGGRIVAVGSAWEDGPARGAVWTSSDGGRSWIEGNSLDGGYGTSVVASADGFVVGGNAAEAGGEPRTWHSSGGEQWTTTTLEARGGVRGVADLTQAPNGLIAVGDPTDHAAAWTSADGRAWSRLPDLPTQGRSAAMAVAASASLVLAAGTIEPDAAPRQPVVWRLSTGGMQSPAPAATSTPASPTSSPTSIRVSWDDEAASLDLAHVFGIVADGGRIYALGNEGRQDAVVLSSDDGLTWQKAELPFPATWNPEPYVDHFARHLVSIDGRLVAFGTVGQLDFLNVVVWESADGGTTWSEVPTGDFMTDAFNVVDATAGPAGLVVASNGFAMATGSVWHSIDGRATWNEVRPGELLNLRAVVGTSTGYVLVGSQCGDSTCAAPHPRIWTSTDGQSWASAPVEGDDSVGAIDHVAISGTGVYAAVGSLEDRYVAWTSADGDSWTLSADLGSVGPLMDYAGLWLTGLSDGIVAITRSGTNYVTWTSSDGNTWTAQETPLPALYGAPVQSLIRGIARLGDRLVLAGPEFPTAASNTFSWAGTIER